MRIPLVGLLTRSPFSRLVELMELVTECVEHVPSLLAASLRGDGAELDRLAKETSIAEGRADQLKNELRAGLPSRVLLPVDRRDLLTLISEMDAIADCAEDIGVLLTLRSLGVPSGFEEPITSYLNAVMTTLGHARELIGELSSLERGGFRGQAREEVRGRIERLSESEHDADKWQDRCAKLLFQPEADIDAVDVFLWSKVLGKVGDIANHAESMGNLFRLFVAE